MIEFDNLAEMDSFLERHKLPTLTERKIKESIPFTISTERIKYLGINLPKETKELYTENYKTLMKEIKDNRNREIFHVPG